MNIRVIIYKTLATFGIKRNKPIIPEVPFKEIVSNIEIEPIEKKGDDGNITLAELKTISAIVRQNQPNKVFEIGTFNGRTTINLAHFSPQNSTVFTLDLPKQDLGHTKFTIEDGDKAYVDKETIGDRYKNNADKIIQLYGDSATFDFKPYYGTIDFMFVDGAHSAPYVINDTEVAFKLIRPGGIILWHDYGIWRGVTKVLNNYFKKDARCKELKHIEGTCFVYYKSNEKKLN